MGEASTCELHEDADLRTVRGNGIGLNRESFRGEVSHLAGNDTKLPEETIPIHPAFHNLIVLDTIDPDAFRRSRRRDLCRVASDHLITFCDQVLDCHLTVREIRPPRGNEPLESFSPAAKFQILSVRVEDVIGIHKFMDVFKISLRLYLFPNAQNNGLVGFNRHDVAPPRITSMMLGVG